MSWFKKLWRQNENKETSSPKYVERKTSLSDPYIIVSPKLGLLNLLGKTGEGLAAEDKQGFSPLFSSCIESELEPPVCDVLLMYCKLTNGGKIINSSYYPPQIFEKSEAPIIVIASPNSGEEYIALGKPEGINLVMILDRCGSNFVNFHTRLFTLMKQGRTMPVAWVELMPQDTRFMKDGPLAIFACNAGQIIFDHA